MQPFCGFKQHDQLYPICRFGMTDLPDKIFFQYRYCENQIFGAIIGICFLSLGRINFSGFNRGLIELIHIKVLSVL